MEKGARYMRADRHKHPCQHHWLLESPEGPTNRVRLASMALPTTWVQRSLLRKCQSRLFHHVGGMDDIKREAVRGGNKGTPTGAARQARTPQRFQLEPAHREHDSIEVIAPGKAPFGKTHNPTFPVSGLTTWG